MACINEALRAAQVYTIVDFFEYDVRAALVAVVVATLLFSAIMMMGWNHRNTLRGLSSESRGGEVRKFRNIRA
jgi:hypothetical protein